MIALANLLVHFESKLIISSSVNQIKNENFFATAAWAVSVTAVKCTTRVAMATQHWLCTHMFVKSQLQLKLGVNTFALFFQQLLVPSVNKLGK